MREFNPQDQSAVRIVAQMDELFAIDAQAGPPRTLKPRGSSASAVGEIQAARSVMNNSETDISCDKTLAGFSRMKSEILVLTISCCNL